jgi:hypothetical protein
VTPHYTYSVFRSPDQFVSATKKEEETRSRNKSPQPHQKQTRNHGLDNPPQQPQRNTLPLFIKIDFQLLPQPPELVHDLPCTNDRPLSPRKTEHLQRLVICQQQQQQQQQRRDFHLFIHQHLDPDFRNVLATRLCAWPSPARLLLQRGGEGGVGLCSFGWEGEEGEKGV